MKKHLNISLKSAATFIIALCVGMTLGFAPGTADAERFKAYVDAQANFKPAASIIIEHDILIMPLLGYLFNASAEKAPARYATISVKGLPGETVLISCSANPQTSRKGFYSREYDCSGAGAVHQQAAVSGHSVKSKIALSHDMHQGSSIAIDVTYI